MKLGTANIAYFKVKRVSFCCSLHFFFLNLIYDSMCAVNYFSELKTYLISHAN